MCCPEDGAEPALHTPAGDESQARPVCAACVSGRLLQSRLAGADQNRDNDKAPKNIRREYRIEIADQDVVRIAKAWDRLPLGHGLLKHTAAP